MSALAIVIANIVVVLATVTSVGVLVRRRLRLCWSFGPFLAAIVVGNRLVTWWPETFYTSSFWTIKETVYALLMLTAALELALMIFHRGFAGATTRVRLVLLAVLGATVVALVTVPSAETYRAALNNLIPRAHLGAFWLFCATAILAALYRLPIDPYHRALMVGFSVYLVPSSLLLAGMGRFGARADYLLGVADQLASLFVFLYWCFATWRRESPPITSWNVKTTLQPWRYGAPVSAAGRR